MAVFGDNLPDFLGKSGRKWVKNIAKRLEIKPEQEESLYQAAHCLDRIQEARDIIDKEGIVAVDRFGQPKTHPATIVEKDNKALFSRMVKDVFGSASETNGDEDPLTKKGFGNL